MGFKVSKKCLYDLKTFSSQNLNMNIKTTQNFTLILKLFRKMRNIFQQKLIGKKRCAKLEFFLFYITTKVFCKQLFLGALFSYYFHGFETSVTFCVFSILIFKKRNKKNLGALCIVRVSIFGTSRMQIRKNWLNQLKKCYNKHF